MTAINNPVEKVTQAFDFLSVDLTEFENGEKFEVDFPRTSEIILIINGEKQVHYQMHGMDTSENSNNKEVEKIRKKFEYALREVNPALETTIKRSLHQGGPLFSGRVALERIIFPRLGLLRGEGSTHKFIIEVVDESKIIVKAAVFYNKLGLLPIESVQNVSMSAEGAMENEVTESQKSKLAKQRKEIFQDYGDRGDEKDVKDLSLPEPLSLTVQYEFCYSEASEHDQLKKPTYQLKKPTNEDITIDVPVKLAEKLFFNASNRTFATDVKDFVSRLKEILAKIITAVIGRHTQDSKESSLSVHTEPSNHIDRPRV